MRSAPRGFCLRLLVGARSRVYLPVDRGGALIGGARFCAPFRSHSACSLGARGRKKNARAQGPAYAGGQRRSLSRG